jgi:hypothetical protein
VWHPARHAEDEWFDKIQGKHRTLLDAVSAHGVGEALHFASNIFTTSKSGYGLESGEVAIVVCLRHGATAFAFNDAMWTKFGEHMSAQTKFTDPKTQAAPTKNLYNSAEFRRGDATFDSLIKLGVHFAVCDNRRRASPATSRARRRAADAVYRAHRERDRVTRTGPVGIVAVGHAQERGYAIRTADRRATGIGD